MFGAGAYVWWGLCPGFFLLLLPASAPEVLAHRIVWSAVFLLVVLVAARRLGDLRRLSARTWLQLLAASALIAINWGTYIWAVTHGHVVDAALGYFINPLISVALGVVIFRERLNRWQLVALTIAVVAVAILTAEVGEVPYIALVLAVSFGLYGLVKKVVDADPRVSVAVETLWALPVAVGVPDAGWRSCTAHFVNLGPGHAALMMLAGPVTAIPLLLFAVAAQRLPLVTLGLLFYLNPATADGLGSVRRPRADAGRPMARLRADLAGAAGVQRRCVEAGPCRSRRAPIVIPVTPSTTPRRFTSCGTAC